ncbi:alpha-L-rhamnosidase N-terminal domain-containing protein [Flavisolibacter sp. BT320]|nr:alpha-L-rhamnosidase N-terminal domain-containing protein [Flavisolibacter longurius]
MTNAQVLTSTKLWRAYWIAAQNDEGRDYGVYHFRKTIELSVKPAAFNIHVSGDNRYKLFVNGTLVSLGPARGDLHHWNYETVNIAPYLRAGKNTVASLVFNEAQYRPEAQFTIRTGFILQGATEAEEVLNTNNTWKCLRNRANLPIPGYFFAASKGEMVDMSLRIKGDWTTVDFDDSAWPAANALFEGKPKGIGDAFAWSLVPSAIPPMEMTYLRIPALRQATGIRVPAGFPEKKIPLTIPANTTATLLLDQTYLTNGYVTMDFSKGKGAGISLGYAETLYDSGSNGRRKSNRNEVEGKEFIGRIDSLLADGSNGQSFTTLNFRTYRYIRLIVQTGEEPLIIEDIYGTFTGYPFQQTAHFQTSDKELKQILDIGWRTARLNAWETYTDCPYYEQLQYIGDTRIQAMVSYYYSGDDRLARNAITLVDRSRLAEGVTLSRYPSHGTQIISTFSLWYIGMLHDYWLYRDDAAFVKDKIAGTRSILEFFRKYQQADGSLKDLPYWTFVDWAGNMGWGPKGSDGSAAIYDLQLLLAYQWAAQLEGSMGLPAFASLYNQKAAQLKQTIQRKYWDPQRKLYADTKGKKEYSQHTNSLAILAGVADKTQWPALAKRMLADTTLTQCTVYFKYYLHQALVKAGLGNDFLSWLDIWRENIKMGLTTWAEESNLQTARSECHAWGSSPNIEFFRVVLGIDSDAPGFRKIRIEPHLGKLSSASGEMPHPNGKVAVAYQRDNKVWKITCDLPPNTTGSFVWKGKAHNLKAGKNTFAINDTK